MSNKTVLHKLPFYDKNNKSNINCAEYYNNYLYDINNLYTLNYLIQNAKRGDLIINIFIEKYRNYNIGIIDIDKNSNIIIIKSLDELDCYEGYPHIPINFLDLVINNANYFKDEISINYPELEKSCMNLYKIKLIIYNQKLFQINNTKILIGFKDNILSIKDIIFKLQNNINYDSKDKLIINELNENIVIIL